MTDSKRGALIESALEIANKGIQVADGFSYQVPSHDLVLYAATIKALVAELEDQELQYRCTGPDGQTPRALENQERAIEHQKMGCGTIQQRRAGAWEDFE